MPTDPQDMQRDEDRFVDDALAMADEQAVAEELATGQDEEFNQEDSRVEDFDDQEERAREVQAQDDLIKGDGLVTDELIPEDPDAMTPPDNWSAAEEFGNTAAEQRAGEDLDLRERQSEREEAPH